MLVLHVRALISYRPQFSQIHVEMFQSVNVSVTKLVKFEDTGEEYDTSSIFCRRAISKLNTLATNFILLEKIIF